MKQLIDLKAEEVLRELDVIWEEVSDRKEKKRQEIEKEHSTRLTNLKKAT